MAETDDQDILAAGAGPTATALAVGAGLLAIPQAFLIGDAVVAVLPADFARFTDLPPTALFLLIALLGLLRAAAEASAAHLAGLRAADFKETLRLSWLIRSARWSPLATGRPPAGDVADTLVDRVETLDGWLVRYPLARARMIVLPVAILAAVAPVSWVVALLLALAGPVIPVFMALIGAEAQAESRRQLDEAGRLGGLLLDRLGGLASLRALGAGERVAQEIGEAGDRLRRRTMAVLRIAFLSSAALEFFTSVGIALTALYIGFRLLGWYDFGGDFGLAGGLAMLILAPDFFQPMRDFAAAYHDRAAARALADRSAAVFGTARPEMAARPHAAAPAGVAIDLRSVTLGLPERPEPLLDDVSLEVRFGERVALVGRSGSGKTTLLALAAGLVDGHQGTVHVSGRIGWLGQEPFVLSASVARNLDPFGRAAPDEAELWRALSAVRLDAVVRRLPRGLLTPLGEDGAGLSRGELRRLDIARLLLRRVDVVLADEPTADLDPDTAATVRAALVAAAEGRTLVVATHDRHLAALMDRSILVDRGRLTEAAR